MPPTWQKQGVIFRPQGQFPWMLSHATSPFVLHLGGDRYRIYFSCRDAEHKAHIAFVEISMADPSNILAISEVPVLAPGPWGYFDDRGVYGRCVVDDNGRLNLFYLGWNSGVDSMFYCAIGHAISDDGGLTFKRHSPAPIMERSRHDPWCVLLPYVLQENGVWRMWYASGQAWRQQGAHLQSVYDIKYAESDDGLVWRRDGHVAIPLTGNETNVAHPCVVRDPNGYTMWYSRNYGAAYRIGWAKSQDGLTWQRMDESVGIDVSQSGFDSEMVCQPHVFSHDGRRYMLYNGNGFGRDGLALAAEDNG